MNNTMKKGYAFGSRASCRGRGLRSEGGRHRAGLRLVLDRTVGERRHDDAAKGTGYDLH
jgi:hypothetical protein